MTLNNTIKIVLGSFAMLLSNVLSHAQIIGSDAYAIGDHVEIGINGQGGHEGAASLAGSNNRSNQGLTSPVYFGFVANPQLDSWTEYDGDFFTPGSPENGFGLQINGLNYGNNALPSNEIIGGLIGYEELDECINIEWEGEVNGVTINVIYRLLSSNLYYTTEVTLTNNTGVDLTDLYYYRNVDPDNNVTITGDYSTINTIVSQPVDSCQKALVSAEQTTPWDSYVGFGALGSKFRVSHGGFSNRVASDIWNGSSGFNTAVGSTIFADQAISLAYKTDLLNGASESFTFAVVLSESAVEEAFQGLYYIDFEALGVSSGSVANACNISVDTASTCGGNPVQLEVSGPNIEDFDWVWSPTSGLSDSIGTTTSATPTETTVYTVTGTPNVGCLVTPIVKTIVVEYLDGPQIEIVDPGPICGVFELTTLEYSDLNGVTGTVSNFFSEIPVEATQTEPLWPTSTIMEGDSVYLMVADTVNGCFDWELVNINYGNPANAGGDTTITYCAEVNDTLNLNTLIAVDADLGGYFEEETSSGSLDPTTGYVYLVGLPSGTYDYAYIVGDSLCGMDTAHFMIVINALINVTVTSSDAACGSADGFASVAATGGMEPYTYLWSTGDTTMTIEGLSAGSYSVLVTDAMGCQVETTIEIQGIESTIQIDKLFIDDVTCNGGNNGVAYILAEGGIAPYTYVWSTGTVGPEVSGLSAGTYSVTITDALGCSITVEVTVDELAPIDATVSIDGAYLIANQDSASYQWLTCPDMTPIVGETDQSFCTPPFCDDVEYAVIVTTSFGCSETSDCVSLSDGGSLSVASEDSREISIYPNPTTGNVFIRIENTTEKYQLLILDIKGSVILEKPMNTITEMLDLSKLSNGIYFVQLKSESSIVTRKITVRK